MQNCMQVRTSQPGIFSSTMLSTQGYRVLAFQLTDKLSVLAESNDRAVEARIGGGGDGLNLPIRWRENQDYADGTTSTGGRWQDMSFGQGRRGSGGHTRYGAGGGRTLAFSQAARGRYWSAQLRGAGGYSGRIAPLIKGFQMDALSRMVSLNRGVRA